MKYKKYYRGRVTCPYCKNEFSYQFEYTAGNNKEIVLCDIEETPGCDRYFAVYYYFKPIVKYYKMTETE